MDVHTEGVLSDGLERVPGAGVRVRWALVLAVLAVLLLHSLVYLPFVADDAFISLRYSARLLEGRGLTWTDGERIEGYSNLLWVLALASYGLAGGDLPQGLRVLGLLSMSAGVVALMPPAALRRRADVSDLFPALFFVLTGPIAVWSIGGMEQALVAALLAWSLAFLLQDRRGTADSFIGWQKVGVPLGLLCLCRPDSPLLVLGMAAAAAWTHRRTPRLAIVATIGMCAVPALCVASQAVFRLGYYGEWLPNTAYVKLSPSWQHALGGLSYVLHGIVALAPLVLLAAVSAWTCWRKRFRRDQVLVLSILALLWAGYLVVIGGDVFPAWRHFVPVIVVLVFLLRLGWTWFSDRARGTTYRKWVLTNLVMLAAYFPLQLADSENARASSERWEWEGKAIGEMLGRAFAEERPLLAVDAAGALPYFAGLPALDMLGLNDSHIAGRRGGSRGEGAIGHELGDGQYVLDRAPDLVMFGPPPGSERGVFLSGIEMQHLSEFWRHYLPQRFLVRRQPDFAAILWVRWTSTRIGVRCAHDRCVLPSYVLTAVGGAMPQVIVQEQAGRLVIGVSPGLEVAPPADLQIPPGRWEVSVVSGGSPVALRVGGEGAPATEASSAVLAIDEGNRVDLRLSSTGPQPSWIEEVILTRI